MYRIRSILYRVAYLIGLGHTFSETHGIEEQHGNSSLAKADI